MESTPIKRGSGPRRSKRVKPVNRARKAKRWRTSFGSSERVEWMRQLNCCVCGRTPCEVAHVRSRAAGGTAADTVPLCNRCHREQHVVGVETFAARHNLDLTALAQKYDRWWTEGLATGRFTLGF
jgi:hypothetical protein